MFRCGANVMHGAWGTYIDHVTGGSFVVENFGECVLLSSWPLSNRLFDFRRDFYGRLILLDITWSYLGGNVILLESYVIHSNST